MKATFIMSEKHHVIQDYVNHKGSNFRAESRVGEQEFEILCCQINIDKTNYTFIRKADLERGLRDDLLIGLVLFIDGQKPTKYLIPSTVWNEPSQLFTDSAIKHSEYGINLNKNTIHLLKDQYSFNNKISII